jgi:16S rRNA (cytosine1402-N4)-methyltransferase
MTNPGHTPVLTEAVLQLLQPRTASRIVDCTLGLGGHAEALLKASGTDAQLVGMDADADNVILAKRHLAPFRGRVRFFHANFSQIRDVLDQADLPACDALLGDLGVASVHLDEPQRGMSFSAPGPLDMRLDRSEGQTAADLVNTLREQPMADLIYQYGEERYSRRIARAIVQARAEQRIERTDQLAEIIRRAYPPPARRSRRGVDPATRTFQALRIAVNDELGSLEELLAALPEVMAPGGRVAIISFHSLEDRRVKQAFNALVEAGKATLLTKKPITAGPDERSANPRSRSAKLRGIRFV